MDHLSYILLYVMCTMHISIKSDSSNIAGNKIVRNLQCNAPYRGHPINFFYKLANHVILYFMNKEEDVLIG